MEKSMRSLKIMNENSLSKDKIKKILKTEYIGKQLYFFEKTTSTFDEADKIEKENGAVICARIQTNGRGRLGRNWESQTGGIYFSVILKPDVNMDKVHIMTSLCAVGVQKAISKYTPCKIKWPNDIVSNNGKKLCGILTKLQYNGHNDECYINVGIGINANTRDFDDELKYASSIKIINGHDIDENKLLCECLYEIEKSVDVKNISITMEEYKKNCLTLGSRVRILYVHDEKTDTGKCIDLLSDGSLIVLKDDGEVINVNSGEVSVRGIYGDEYV